MVLIVFRYASDWGCDSMTNIRGKARQDCRRALTLAKHIEIRMDWQTETYSDHPDYALGCEVAVKTAIELQKLLEQLVAQTP